MGCAVPCSTTDGSIVSNFYPCICGTTTCGLNQLCTSLASKCQAPPACFKVELDWQCQIRPDCEWNTTNVGYHCLSVVPHGKVTAAAWSWPLCLLVAFVLMIVGVAIALRSRSRLSKVED